MILWEQSGITGFNTLDEAGMRRASDGRASRCLDDTLAAEANDSEQHLKHVVQVSQIERPLVCKALQRLVSNLVRGRDPPNSRVEKVKQNRIENPIWDVRLGRNNTLETYTVYKTSNCTASMSRSHGED
jgi:hypothetical protein